MIRTQILALALASLAAAAPSAAVAQPDMQAISGTRLDIVATGEVNRVPDVAVISAGVMTQAPTASEALRQNSGQMNRVLAALKRAGVAERDIQTNSVNLNPEYRYGENQPPRLTGYRANNQVSVRFRDIAESGKILDALVAEGANQINGPNLQIDKPEAALDEARAAAVRVARQRAEIYAKAIGKRVGRILSISESGAMMPQPMPMARMGAAADMETAKIMPGEQTLGVTLSVSFELE